MDIDPPFRKIGPVLDRWKSFKRNSSKVRNKRDISEGSFVTNEEVGVHDINVDYNTVATEIVTGQRTKNKS